MAGRRGCCGGASSQHKSVMRPGGCTVSPSHIAGRTKKTKHKLKANTAKAIIYFCFFAVPALVRNAALFAAVRSSPNRQCPPLPASLNKDMSNRLGAIPNQFFGVQFLAPSLRSVGLNSFFPFAAPVKNLFDFFIPERSAEGTGKKIKKRKLRYSAAPAAQSHSFSPKDYGIMKMKKRASLKSFFHLHPSGLIPFPFGKKSQLHDVMAFFFFSFFLLKNLKTKRGTNKN